MNRSLKSKKTIIRNLLMLNLIPQSPGKICVSAIALSLREAGFQVSNRTIQRDLKVIQSYLPLTFEEEEDGQRYAWSWLTGAHPQRAPVLDPRLCVIVLAASHCLDDVFPQTIQSYLSRIKLNAQSVLDLPGMEAHQTVLAQITHVSKMQKATRKL